MMKKNASTLKLCKNLFKINQTDIEMSVFFSGKSLVRADAAGRSGHTEAAETNLCLLTYISFKNGTLRLVL